MALRSAFQLREAGTIISLKAVQMFLSILRSAEACSVLSPRGDYDSEPALRFELAVTHVDCFCNWHLDCSVGYSSTFCFCPKRHFSQVVKSAFLRAQVLHNTQHGGVFFASVVQKLFEKHISQRSALLKINVFILGNNTSALLRITDNKNSLLQKCWMHTVTHL